MRPNHGIVLLVCVSLVLALQLVAFSYKSRAFADEVVTGSVFSPA